MASRNDFDEHEGNSLLVKRIPMGCDSQDFKHEIAEILRQLAACVSVSLIRIFKGSFFKFRFGL